MLKISMIGLGKLGLACAQVMAEKYEVVGYDVAPRSSNSVKVKSTVQEAVSGCDLIFIAVQTPHDPKFDGSKPISHLEKKDFDYAIVKDSLLEVNKYVTKNQLVVLISTVLPGTTRGQLRECITNARFIYNPYLIAMGSVEWDMVNPEMVIIGTEDGNETGDAKMLVDFYKPLMQNNPRYVIGTWDEAESIKIFYNTFISAKVGIVNMIQDVAMRNGNINVDVVTDALSKSTIRIMSPKYMVAGMGDAGPCHPRDNIALRYLAEKLDLGYDLFDTIINAREIQAKNLADFLVHQSSLHDLPIFIHGKAYKPNVSFLDGSYSTLVGHYVEQAGKAVSYIDPLTEETTPASIMGVVLLAHSAEITYGYAGEHKDSLYTNFLPGSVVVDPWRQFSNEQAPGCHVIHYGNTRISNA
jgi:UDPglucose 6-dehydrogenase